MVESLKNPIMGVANYLDWESQQTEKHDFVGNEVFAMTGGTLRRNRATLRATLRATIAFEHHLAGTPCKSQHWYQFGR